MLADLFDRYDHGHDGTAQERTPLAEGKSSGLEGQIHQKCPGAHKKEVPNLVSKWNIMQGSVDGACHVSPLIYKYDNGDDQQGK